MRRLLRSCASIGLVTTTVITTPVHLSRTRWAEVEGDFFNGVPPPIGDLLT
jgi:hypothetical protein